MKHLRFLILFAPFLLIPFLSYAQYTPDKGIIVELSNGKDFIDLRSSQLNWRNTDFKIRKKLSQHRQIYLLETDAQLRNKVMQELSMSALYKEVFPDEFTSIRVNPNDPEFDKQRNLKKIDVSSVWDYTTGGQTIENDNIVVAVMDDGFYVNAEDVKDNFYKNTIEAQGDANGDGCPGDCGVDDDGDGLIDEDNMGRIPGQLGYNNQFRKDDDENGYIDDILGLNLNNGTDNHTVKNHGISVASVIGAKGNNGIGVTGINWDSHILLLSSGTSRARVIEGYSYMITMRKLYNDTKGEKGAFIVASNYSLGIDDAFPEDYPIWCSLYDDLGRVGIISCVATTNTGQKNVDVSGDMPTLCESKYMIAVASSDESESIVSGFGPKSVDITAPGAITHAFAPLQNPQYGSFGGTSAACPHLSGVIALLYSVSCKNFINKYKSNPELVYELGERIINAGDKFSTLDNRVRTGKRLNAYKALLEVNKDCTDSPVNLEGLDLVVLPNPTQDEVKIYFNADFKKNTYLNIYNALGQKMYGVKLEKDLFQENTLEFSIKDYAAGVYYFTLSQGTEKRAYPVVKL